jgi:ribonucleoside-diphosphate reductase alpha chain
VNENTVAASKTQSPSDFANGGVRMMVEKRDGTRERVDVRRIADAVERHSTGLTAVDPTRVAIKTIGGLQDGATTRQLDQVSIQVAADLTGEEPEYSRLAARLLAAYVEEDVAALGVHSFRDSIMMGVSLGLINDRVRQFVGDYHQELEAAISRERNQRFEYFGLKTVCDRYLLRHPTLRTVVETPQYFFMRIASALAADLPEALALYNLMSNLEYLPSSPTLFNSGTKHEQLSSCFLLDSPNDHLADIYDRYKDIALLSKFSGGIGLAFSRVRTRGSLIESTNGHSNGIVPWLKTLDASVSAVNQGGKRKGACCVYLEPWHADIEEFLELRDNTGDEARRTHNLNLANWVCDLFMRRVEADEQWSLFDPKVVPHLVDLFGEEFDKAYAAAEAEGLAKKQVSARQLYGRMMRTLAETGNGWMTFKDASNRTCNQTGTSGKVVHLSNLCTEIIEVTSSEEAAVCNLGSINLVSHIENGKFNFAKLRETVARVVPALDRVIDRNFYPIAKTQSSNVRWRPVGLGVMGLADAFYTFGWEFDSPESNALNRQIFEEIYFAALKASADLAEKHGTHPSYAETRAAKGQLQMDLWGIEVDEKRWGPLRERIAKVGLRNSLLIAIAPTATIASIAGCAECIEPPVSNLYKRETLSGDFIQVNRYLVAQLKALDLYTPQVRDAIKRGQGSVQDIAEIPEQVRRVFRTAWELPMRSLIDMAATRGAFIDQSQSLNLFIENPNIGVLSSMYFYAWKKKLKTTYYLRSRPATRIGQTTVSSPPPPSGAPLSLKPEPEPEAAVACSLENPESCEACQ